MNSNLKKKYLVISGYVRSMSDSELHYVHTRELIRLYDVNPQECLEIDGTYQASVLGFRKEDFIVLEPREDGNYSVKEIMKNRKDFK